MAERLETLREILLSIERRSLREWLYLPRGEAWDLDSLGATLESPEVPPHLEDDPEAGIPDFAKAHDLVMALDVGTVQDVKANLGSQVSRFTTDQLLAAFLFYHGNDAFALPDE